VDGGRVSAAPPGLGCSLPRYPGRSRPGLTHFAPPALDCGREQLEAHRGLFAAGFFMSFRGPLSNIQEDLV
jgi:hypothetical protein